MISGVMKAKMVRTYDRRRIETAKMVRTHL
jgi:hypothetical protein